MPSHSADPCSSGRSSDASEKSFSVHPIVASSSSIEARVPEPGLPTLNRLPLRSSKPLMLDSLRATTVNGSGWIEKTERSFG
ncbi:hypothetical protein D3C81_1968330 [compost metagenome]